MRGTFVLFFYPKNHFADQPKRGREHLDLTYLDILLGKYFCFTLSEQLIASTKN